MPEKVEKVKTSYVVMKGSKSDIQNMKQQMGVINYNIPGSFFRFSDQNEIPTDVEVAHIVTETDVDGFSPPPEALSPKDGETTEKVREAVNKSNMSMFSEHSSGSQTEEEPSVSRSQSLQSQSLNQIQSKTNLIQSGEGALPNETSSISRNVDCYSSNKSLPTVEGVMDIKIKPNQDLIQSLARTKLLQSN